MICFDATEREQWRVRVEGHFKRLKIWPDGNTQRYDGEGNFPAREAKQIFKLGPSSDEKRLEVVRTVFEMYANQAITGYGIANYLNKAGIKPNYRESYWLGSHIYSMLRNTAYIGKPASNKFGQGEFLEDDGEVVRPVVTTKGRRERPKTAWWIPDHEVYDPLIDKPIWEKVQEKIEGHETRRRAPKNPELWLSGFVHCARCGQRMRGQKRPHYCQFSCPTGEADKKNKFGCLRNAINQQMIERVLVDYLTEIGEAMKVFQRVQKTGDTLLLDSLHDHLGQNLADNMDVSLKMAKFVSEFAGDSVLHQLREKFPTSEYVPEEDGGKLIHLAIQEQGEGNLEAFWEAQKATMVKEEPATDSLRLSVVYDLLFEHHVPALKARLDELETEREAAAQKLFDLPKSRSARTLKAAQDRLIEVEAKMDEVEAMLTNLTGKAKEGERQTKQILTSIWDARKAIDEQDDLRCRSEALAQVIDRINVWFEPTGKKYPQTLPAWCEIIPKVGAERVYRFDGAVEGTTDAYV